VNSSGCNPEDGPVSAPTLKGSYDGAWRNRAALSGPESAEPAESRGLYPRLFTFHPSGIPVRVLA